MFSKIMGAFDTVMNVLVMIFIAVFLLGIIGAIVFVMTQGGGFGTWYGANTESIKSAIEIISVISTFFVALATLGMMYANKKMVAATNRQISLMKNHHILAISPRIEIVPDTFSLGELPLRNITATTAYDVTIFARIRGEIFSRDLGSLEPNEVREVALGKGSLYLFLNHYSRHSLPPKWFRDFFYGYMKHHDVIFIAYVDAEGNIHGTAEQCSVKDRTIEIAPLSSEGDPAPSDEEKIEHILRIPLRVTNHRFIIVEEDVPPDEM